MFGKSWLPLANTIDVVTICHLPHTEVLAVCNPAILGFFHIQSISITDTFLWYSLGSFPYFKTFTSSKNRKTTFIHSPNVFLCVLGLASIRNNKLFTVLTYVLHNISSVNYMYIASKNDYFVFITLVFCLYV